MDYKFCLCAAVKVVYWSNSLASQGWTRTLSRTVWQLSPSHHPGLEPPRQVTQPLALYWNTVLKPVEYMVETLGSVALPSCASCVPSPPGAPNVSHRDHCAVYRTLFTLIFWLIPIKETKVKDHVKFRIPLVFTMNSRGVSTPPPPPLPPAHNCNS